MTQPPPQQTGLVRWLIAFALLLCVIPLGWLGHHVWQQQVFYAERQPVLESVESWGNHPPQNVDPHVWREATIIIYNAVGNACYSPDKVSIEEVRRLRADVEAKNGEPVTLQTLDWLWWRLGETGPHGAKCAAQWYPLWEDAREQVRSSAIAN